MEGEGKWMKPQAPGGLGAGPVVSSSAGYPWGPWDRTPTPPLLCSFPSRVPPALGGPNSRVPDILYWGGEVPSCTLIGYHRVRGTLVGVTIQGYHTVVQFPLWYY